MTLTSKAALEELLITCHTKKTDAIERVIFGLSISGLGGLGFFMPKPDGIEIMDILAGVMSGAGFGLFLDGISYLSLDQQNREGPVFYRIFGLAKGDTITNRIFGKAVTPLDTLRFENSGYVFINGFEIDTFEYHQNITGGLYGNFNVSTSLIMKGQFKQNILDVITSRGIDEFKELKTNKLYLLGELRKTNSAYELNAEKLGPAL